MGLVRQPGRVVWLKADLQHWDIFVLPEGVKILLRTFAAGYLALVMAASTAEAATGWTKGAVNLAATPRIGGPSPQVRLSLEPRP